MKFWTIACCGLLVVGSANAAAAGPDERGTGLRPLLQDQRSRPGPQRGADRAAPQRDARGTDQDERGRMSPEERRQLRRDIQDAGKDIYRPSRHGRGDGRRSGGR
ncbi:MAG: hypothetical protein IH605_15110 [Burkholderiales bacterium]|nr:hypothetical protein [Burkholderiales bacterium]